MEIVGQIVAYTCLSIIANLKYDYPGLTADELMEHYTHPANIADLINYESLNLPISKEKYNEIITRMEPQFQSEENKTGFGQMVYFILYSQANIG